MVPRKGSEERDSEIGMRGRDSEVATNSSTLHKVEKAGWLDGFKTQMNR
jgi:hypothetical protein